MKPLPRNGPLKMIQKTKTRIIKAKKRRRRRSPRRKNLMRRKTAKSRCPRSLKTRWIP
jgi:hypothetical protein